MHPHTLQEAATVSVADIANANAVESRVVEADISLGAWQARLLTWWRALNNCVHSAAQPLARLSGTQQAASQVVLCPHARRHEGDRHGWRLASLAATHNPARTFWGAR